MQKTITNKILLTLPAIIFFIIGLFVLQVQHKWKHNQVLKWDAFGYHSYLPSLLIYKDWKKVSFLDSILTNYEPSGNKTNRFGFNPVAKTGNVCNQYTMGVAMMHAPGFAIAHGYSKWFSSYPADGYSFHYQKANAYTNLLYASLGILLLTFFLSTYFSSTISVITTILIGFGTNLLYYSYHFSGLSHPCLFFLYAAILYLTQTWYLKPSWLKTFGIGLCVGLCVLIRPIDVLVVLIPLLWPHKNKLTFWLNHWKHIVAIALLVLLVCLPQLFYWKSVTDSWLYYSYNKEVDYFDFSKPHIIQGLLSYQNGWFVYTPLVLVAIAAAFAMGNNTFEKKYNWVLFVFFIPYIYLVFSWHDWFYGWSYGCRALIQTLPLLAFPLAWYLQHLASKQRLQKTIASACFGFILFLNIFQSWQFEKGILLGSLMNEKYYWSVFLSTHKDPKLDRILYLQQQMESEFGW